MKCWVARSHSKTHIRVQIEPFTHPWAGWDLREGTISQKDLHFLETSYGPDTEVERERIHQEVWLRAAGPRGRPIAFGNVQAGPRQDLR